MSEHDQHIQPTTVEVDPVLASERLRDYLALQRKRALTRIEQMERLGYAAIKRGARIIDLHRTIIAAGLSLSASLPVLAVGRASAKRVIYLPNTSHNPDSFRMTTSDKEDGARYTMPTRYRTLRFERRDFAPVGVDTQAMPALNPRDWEAYIPEVPPALKIDHEKHFDRLLVLFQAIWQPFRRTREIKPVDPYLLRHIGGSLYEVLGEWDVTPIEAAAMQTGLLL